MADVICRWRNGTPKTVVELVNSLPHKKMPNTQFRSFMSDKWDGDFFTSAYQLACQLGLYCEAEDGFYYPRFDHDINEDEAQEYLEFWLPRYYVPNPYVGKDGFTNISSPVFFLKEIYDFVLKNPSSTYQEAFKHIFKEDVKNNDDIVRNYINRFSKVLKVDKDNHFTITDYKPEKVFGFMDRNNKKEFFDTFSDARSNPPTESLQEHFIASDLENKKQIFYDYLTKKKGLSDSTAKQYAFTHPFFDGVTNIVKSVTHKENLFEVIDLFSIDKIHSLCRDLPENKTRNNVYTATLKSYKDFIDFLDSEDPNLGIGLTKQSPTVIKSEFKPFSIATVIDLIAKTGLLYSDGLIKRLAFSLMSKPFLILSGLAGSGKTQLALAFAKALIAGDDQLCVISVGADWTNREPLLGFPNALESDAYVRPESGVLDLLIEANKEENSAKPYFLILDEMNMSYVERYFSDFLSAMESHEPIALWKGSSSQVPQRIQLPKNLFIIGTINVDETTYMFSPKVLDRANVIEFKIDETEMEDFLKELKPVDRDSVNFIAHEMGASFVEIAGKKELAADPSVAATLGAFFKELKSVNAEFGYRSATEIYRFVRQCQENDDTKSQLSIDEILDFAIVQKLLPKLHGSRKKLQKVLEALWKLSFESPVDKELPISRENCAKAKYPLTADKLQRMNEAAYDNGFTSFAEA